MRRISWTVRARDLEPQEKQSPWNLCKLFLLISYAVQNVTAQAPWHTQMSLVLFCLVPFVLQADMNKLITRKFKLIPATQAEARDCATAVGRDQLAKVLTMKMV